MPKRSSWHIKIRYLPNAVSQSLRIQLALNSLIRTPVSLAEKHSKAKTGRTIPRIRHKPNSWAFVSLQGKTLFIWQIKVAKTAKAKLCATKNRHNYLKFCAFAKKNRSFFDKPRLQRLPKRSSAPQQGRGEGLRERGKLRVEKVGFPSPFCLTTLQKVEFALLFQKPIQDPSTRLRLGRDDRLWPPKLCARNHSGKRGKDFPKTKKNFKPSHSFRFRAG